MKKPGRGRAYPQEIKNECRALFVEKRWTLQKIADHYEGTPSYAVLGVWARQKPRSGPNTGKTWWDLRAEADERRYHEMSPRSMAMRIMDKIWEALNSDMELGKLGDLLAKTQKSLEKLTDPAYQVPVMYQMLTDEVIYAKRHYPDVVNERFLEFIRDYKNHVRSRLENDFS